MINYIIQVILFQLLFVLIYDLFLSKETFFTKNRYYLLSTALVSFLLPFLKITSFQKVVSKENIIMLPEIVLSPQKVIEEIPIYQSINYMNIIFVSGVVFFLALFILKLIKVINLIVKNDRIKEKGYSLILLPKKSKAFSFFNFIFIGKEIPKEKRIEILAHELVHSEQKHTLDLLLFELMKIVMWFNPMLYIYQKRITIVHEFISDQIVSKSVKKSNYINSLISEVFQVENVSFVNQFYKESLIKKRIMMMNKVSSKKAKQLKYLLVAPLLILMVLYVSCSSDNEVIQEKQAMVFYSGSFKKKQIIDEKKTYMDKFSGLTSPTTKEYFFSDLTKEEKEEYDMLMEGFVKRREYTDQIRVFKGENGRKIIYYDMMVALNNRNVHNFFIKKNKDGFPFSHLDVVPTFSGCETGDKDCFTKSMTKHVKNNFDIEKAKKLGLSSGSKRIYVQFKINKEGNVTDVKSRAPHPVLKEQAEDVINKLPQFKAGKLKGHDVITVYTLPITFNVE